MQKTYEQAFQERRAFRKQLQMNYDELMSQINVGSMFKFSRNSPTVLYDLNDQDFYDASSLNLFGLNFYHYYDEHNKIVNTSKDAAVMLDVNLDVMNYMFMCTKKQQILTRNFFELDTSGSYDNDGNEDTDDCIYNSRSWIIHVLVTSISVLEQVKKFKSTPKSSTSTSPFMLSSSPQMVHEDKNYLPVGSITPGYLHLTNENGTVVKYLQFL